VNSLAGYEVVKGFLKPKESFIGLREDAGDAVYLSFPDMKEFKFMGVRLLKLPQPLIDIYSDTNFTEVGLLRSNEVCPTLFSFRLWPHVLVSCFYASRDSHRGK